MRVLLTVPHLKSTASPYRTLMAIAMNLPQSEFGLTVCSLREDGYGDTAPLLEAKGISVLVARFRPRGRTLRHLAASVKDQRVIARYGPFKIQHSLDFTSSPLEALFAKLAGRSFVFNQRNLNIRGHATLLRVKIALASRIVANSAAVRQLLLDSGAPAGRVQTVYLGIDPEEGGDTPAPPPQGLWNMILSVGQIVRIKRHEDAIRALSLLSDEMPELKLRIAGAPFDAAYAGELSRLVEEMKLTDRVEFLGPRRDVLQLMRQADCLILCSEREAFANAILEAMSSGLAVIASAVDGCKEAIEAGETGLLVPPGDVEGYARALRTILTDGPVRRTMGERGRKVVSEKFSVSRMAGEIASIYKDVVA